MKNFDHAMLTDGFKINECDKCVYIKHTDQGYAIVCLYVDDMLIIESNQNIIKSTKQMLNKRFDMKDIGVADLILGIRITKTSMDMHYLNHIILRKFLINLYQKIKVMQCLS